MNEKLRIQELVDKKFGIETVKDGRDRLGFIANFKTSIIKDEELNERSVLQIYYIEENGNWCKSIIQYNPYFYLSCENNLEKEIAFFLEKKYQKNISKVEIIEKVDLEMPNHLSGRKKKYIKLKFNTVSELMYVRNQIKPQIDRRKQYKPVIQNTQTLFPETINLNKNTDLTEYITDIREYDVPYHSRVCIDLNIRAAKWYKISFKDNVVNQIVCMENIVERPELKYLAFDIETSKAQLQFPDAKIDVVMMISLMYEGDAYLIVNREFCGQDVEGFEYAPKPEFECTVNIFNVKNEYECIKKFFDIIVSYRAFIITSFNGDKFDWPFIHERCNQVGLSLEKEIGINLEEGPEYFGRFITHLDCLYWVIRDAYLPQGSHGLKSVTKAKLGYQPIEVDPEKMVFLAKENTQILAEYSVSDAVATYFLYKKHIHDFIFALCTIIPCYSDEVLRKGSGTLCENLLMTEAFNRNIIFPNKKMENKEKMHKGHWLDSETYQGGKVECLRSGVFRSDIKTKFQLEKNAFQTLIDNVDKLLEFVMKIEQNRQVEELENYEDVRNQIVEGLEKLRDIPNVNNYEDYPLIYHLDVAAMYPNIILTNRLQPVAIVNEQICSSCLFNSPENQCKRPLEWMWKGEYFPLNRSEFETIKSNLEYERALNSENNNKDKNYYEINNTEDFYKQLKQRVKVYSQKTYKTMHISETTLKQNTVCMRENSFYIDTVRAFRDRRYTYKTLVKVWKGKAEEASQKGDTEGKKEAGNLEALYESMQLAHKIILNSFYGYVMRKGARWYSMEMAAMVTHIGSSIILDAKNFIDCVGKPLELDTDGIWCLLPKGFPESFQLKFVDGKKWKIEYPCSILNYLIYEKYCNDQYQTLKDETNLKYESNKEMSIFFELDGPYKAMVIPAAREEGKLLKKRYVVYNHNGKIAEIKGFEIKRRGELEILKIFQSEIFSEFLAGSSLKECYEACAFVARKWLNLLIMKGQGLTDDELIDYICQTKVLSKQLQDYGEQKGVGLTCAKRLKEFLGPDVAKGKSLNCIYVMSAKPVELSRAERAIPVQIFGSDNEIRKRFLKKWLKDNSLGDEQLELRNILDWDYYIERLSNAIQKIIIIPATIQSINNILPEVAVPDWLKKRLREQDSKFQQQKIGQYFTQQQQTFSIKNKQQQQIGSIPQTTHIKIIQEQKQEIVQEPKKKKHNPYNMNTQFKEFLSFQKMLWLEQKKQIEKPQLNNIRQIFSNQDHIILQQDWHILQIIPSEQLGIYRIWIYPMQTRNLIQIKVQIPRVIYMNSLCEYKLEDNNFFKLVKKKLPREKKAHFLYEVSKNENEIHEKLNDFDYFLTNPEIENIYEHLQPLDFKFLTYIGNIMKVNNKILPKNTSYTTHVFSMEQLIGQFDVLQPYLDNIDLSKNLIYVAELKMKEKKIWGILNPIMNQYNFILVHKNKDFNKYNKLVKDSLPQNWIKANMTINIHNVDDNNKALQFIETYFSEIKEKNHQNTYFSPLIVLQSSFSLQNLKELGYKQLVQNFPCIQMNNWMKIQENTYTILDWQKKGIKYICQRSEKIQEELDYAIQLCSQVQIPLCNLDFSKPISYLTDVIFARLLKQSNCISWYGIYSNNQNNNGQTQKDFQHLIPSDFLKNEVVFPGLYVNHTVEINIELLALNTIANADELKNIDKETSILFEMKKKNNDQYEGEDIDELTQAKQAFKILQTMVQSWINDVQFHENYISDQFIQNIHAWISSQDSPLYDPILSRMLNKLTKKIFQYFIQKLRDLGAKIVYATTNKIILDTGKNTYRESHNYAQYILQTVLAQPLFKVLTLTPLRYFQILILKDSHNYMGILDENTDNIDDNNNIQIVNKWHIGQFLPQKLRNYLEAIIFEYLHKILQEKNNLRNDLLFLEKIEEFCKNYVQNLLSEKLLDAIPDLEKQIRKSKMEIEKIQNQIIQLNDAFEQFQIQERQQIEQQQQINKAMDKKDRRILEADELDALQQQKEEQKYKQKKKKQQQEENQLEEEEEDEEFDSFIVQDDAPISQEQDENNENSQIEQLSEIIDQQQYQFGTYESITEEHFLKKIEILKKKLQEMQQGWNFPLQIEGAKQNYENSILEFLNFLFHILNLDPKINEEIIVIKRNCLKMLKINDFQKIAEYKEPCIILKIQDVVCKNCLHVIELDVFRDLWVCQECSIPYDKYYLENKLIQEIQNEITLYQIQDLYCVKCFGVKDDYLSVNCPGCSTGYKVNIDSNVTPLIGIDGVKVRNSLLLLAEKNQFSVLKHVILNSWKLM